MPWSRLWPRPCRRRGWRSRSRCRKRLSRQHGSTRASNTPTEAHGFRGCWMLPERRRSARRSGAGRGLSNLCPAPKVDAELLEELDAYRSDMLAYMQSYDIIVCPTAAFPGHASRDLEAGWHLPRVQPYVGVQPHGVARRRGPGGHFTRRTSHQRADRGPTLERRRGPGSASACRGAVRRVGDAVGLGVWA